MGDAGLLENGVPGRNQKEEASSLDQRRALGEKDVWVTRSRVEREHRAFEEPKHEASPGWTGRVTWEEAGVIVVAYGSGPGKPH